MRQTRGLRTGICAFAAAGGLLLPRPAQAWLLHEHARISAVTIDFLSKDEQATLTEAWAFGRAQARVRVGREAIPLAPRLCVDPRQKHPVARETPSPAGSFCVGFNALPALAADHSCSPGDLELLLATGGWIRPVLGEAARMEKALAKSGGSILKRIDERRVHDITLQLLDHDYLTRAKAGGAHFQLTRSDNGERRHGHNTENILRDYLARALATGQETNATALYVNYHGAALEIAAEARDRCSAKGHLCEEAGPLLWRALITEAFALHFLEDAFSAGHVVGAWGETSLRFGTHDYYCRHGIDAATFDGDAYTAYGDLFLTDVDARRAGEAAAASLGQVLLVMKPSYQTHDKVELIRAELRRALTVQSFDACIEEHIPSGLDSLADAGFVSSALQNWPRPPLRTPAMPRFRAEVGPFIGASLSGDFALSGQRGGAVPEARVRPAIRVGYGLEGTMARYMDGRFFVELVGAGTLSSLDGDARFGVGGRVHLPFAVLPGDGIFAPFAAIGWGFGVWIARQAALGSVYGFEQPFLLGEQSTVQITLGRDATFLVYPRTEAQRELRYELLLPLVNMRMGHAYSQRVANELELDLGLQMIRLKGENVDTIFGGYLSLSTGSRVYP